jgi:hypothetical protein
MLAADASRFASFALPVPLRIAGFCCASAAAAGPGNREGRLLRKTESGIGQPRLRPTRPEVRSRQTMLCRVRLRPRRHSRCGNTICLSDSRRRKFRRLRFVRAGPLATASGSAAARLIRFESRRLVPRFAGRGCKETQQEDSMKIILMIIAALALVGTTTSRSADCCGDGESCCLIKMPCCAK